MPRFLISLTVLGLFLTGCGGSDLATLRGQTMGTTYTVKVVASQVEKDDLKQEVDRELARVNGLMSTWIPESELSRLNAAPVGEPFEVSPDTLEVIRLSREVSELSEGSFDITVGPLVNLWGFGPDPSGREVPSDDEIAAARERVGFDYIVIDGNTVTKKADIYIDLSAIAKGYGVDRIAELLEARGFENYLVEIGGELRVRGHNDRDTPWTVAIETPAGGLERSIFRTVEIRDQAMATSGDYRNYFEKDGVRYSHTIDPVTGRPITHDLVSVTVLADTTAMADAMATAINVMGAARGLDLAQARNMAVQVIIKTEDGFEERMSPAFEAMSESE